MRTALVMAGLLAAGVVPVGAAAQHGAPAPAAHAPAPPKHEAPKQDASKHESSTHETPTAAKHEARPDAKSAAKHEAAPAKVSAETHGTKPAGEKKAAARTDLQAAFLRIADKIEGAKVTPGGLRISSGETGGAAPGAHASGARRGAAAPPRLRLNWRQSVVWPEALRGTESSGHDPGATRLTLAWLDAGS